MQHLRLSLFSYVHFTQHKLSKNGVSKLDTCTASPVTAMRDCYIQRCLREDAVNRPLEVLQLEIDLLKIWTQINFLTEAGTWEDLHFYYCLTVSSGRFCTWTFASGRICAAELTPTCTILDTFRSCLCWTVYETGISKLYHREFVETRFNPAHVRSCFINAWICKMCCVTSLMNNSSTAQLDFQIFIINSLNNEWKKIMITDIPQTEKKVKWQVLCVLWIFSWGNYINI